MNTSVDSLRARLEAEVGAGFVHVAPDFVGAYRIDGKTPDLVCFPFAPDEVSAVLRICFEADAAVVPWGGGTSMRLGNIPRRVNAAIGLERMAQLIEHDDANLSATAQAGIKVSSFQNELARGRQVLPVDPPLPSRATLGGTTAANMNGPRRMAYGAIRDLVIGMKMLLPDGEHIKSGGKVVKNVAGYDLCKLFVGSLGTLGVITEITFRVAPIPETAATWIASAGLEHCARFCAELSRSPLLPAAVAIVDGATATVIGRGAATPAIAICLEGFEQAVTRHIHDLQSIASRMGLTGDILLEERHARLWEDIRDFGWNEPGVLYRMIVPVASMAEILKALEGSSESETRPRYVAHAGTGTIWLMTYARPTIGRFKALAALTQRHGGHAIIAAAPAQLKAEVDIWGRAPSNVDLMREIKRQFDPKDILNPGRFISGL